MHNRRIILPRKFFRIVRILILSILLAACNLPRATPVVPTFTPAVPTDTVVVPTSAPTVPAPTQPAPPTNTAAPGSITNLLFAPGTTAVVGQGSLQPGQSQTFTLQAGQNQAMILLLYSPNNDAYLAVYEPDGNALLDPSKKWSSWQWLLPKSELYTIQVIAGTTAANFVLTAKVAAPVKFAQGATSATVAGSTPKGYVISYSVYGLAGQTMSVTLDAPGSTSALDIFGLAYGEVLLGVSSYALTWTGKLPSTENYIIEVVPNAGQEINFTLTISIK